MSEPGLTTWNCRYHRCGATVTTIKGVQRSEHCDACTDIELKRLVPHYLTAAEVTALKNEVRELRERVAKLDPLFQGTGPRIVLCQNEREG